MRAKTFVYQGFQPFSNNAGFGTRTVFNA